MITNIDDLYIVNYCHKSCVPLKNIMRLPEEQAFELAYKMAEKNKNTTAFYRFADFENYYYERLETDEFLYKRFLELGGKPAEKHPLSFVLHGSDFLDNWFDNGIVTKISLRSIPADRISFTYGDSMTVRKMQGDLTMLTKKMLSEAAAAHNGTIEDFISEANKKYNYIEVQLWDSIDLND